MKPWPLLIVFALVGCQPPKQAAATLAAPTITIIHPEARTLQKVVEQPGRIEGFEQTPLYSKLPGYVKKWSADIGDVVKEGQVLAELFIPEAEEELFRDPEKSAWPFNAVFASLTTKSTSLETCC